MMEMDSLDSAKCQNKKKDMMRIIKIVKLKKTKMKYCHPLPFKDQTGNRENGGYAVAGVFQF